MNDETRALIEYRMKRSKEALDEAELMLNNGHVNTFINRLYYACFYAVNAILLEKGYSSAKHSGIRSLFHQQIIKSGLLPDKFGKWYDRLYDNRQKADYMDMIVFLKNDVSPWLVDAQELVRAIEKLLTPP